MASREAFTFSHIEITQDGGEYILYSRFIEKIRLASELLDQKDISELQNHQGILELVRDDDGNPYAIVSLNLERNGPSLNINLQKSQRMGQ